ncbi:MAG TPA: hypothetical protein VNN25_17095 [Thermoanaerobaculia bacterium]|nr:hypothetical protein [Thermoanaerobaculia bacterium]
MGRLTITFSGICTHFYRCIPVGAGPNTIPLRSVLPNALGVHFGMVRRPETEANDPVQPMYYLMPHIAVVADTETLTPFTQSNYLYGAQLEVLNPDPLQGIFEFDSSLANGYHLPDFVSPDSGIQPSRDVVQDGNAACYFDFFYGKGQVEGDTNLTTVVTIETVAIPPFDDTPRVRITPFESSLMEGPVDWTVDTNELFVSNQDFDASAEDKPFDFMLNFLTTFPGIPRFLTQNVPGMTSLLTPLTPPLLSEKMATLSEAIRELGPEFPVRGKELPSLVQWLASRIISQGVDLDASCSDSHFP